MTDTTDIDAPEDKTGGAVKEFLEIVKTVAYALGIALVLRVLLFQPFTIPSASMEPNLYQGDYIIVSKYSYGWSKHSIPFSPPLFDGRILGKAPTRGDIIVFKLPRDPNVDYIKRLICLATRSRCAAVRSISTASCWRIGNWLRC
jgi:signal peptidase I